MTERNSLSHKEVYQLTTWLVDNRKALDPRPDRIIADFATEALGFTVRAANVKSAKEASGLAWTQHRNGGPTKARIADLEERVARLIRVLNIEDLLDEYDLRTEDEGTGADT